MLNEYQVLKISVKHGKCSFWIQARIDARRSMPENWAHQKKSQLQQCKIEEEDGLEREIEQYPDKYALATNVP